MPLCGSQNGCGCAIVSTPAASGSINGFYPSIDVDGNGTPSDPWDLHINADWLALAAGRVGAWGKRTTNQTLPAGVVTRVTFAAQVGNTPGFFTGGGDTFVVPPGKAGIYALTFWAQVNTGITGQSRINTTGATAEVFIGQLNAGGMVSSVTVPLEAGDSVFFAIYNGSGATDILRAQGHVWRVAN